MSSDAATGLVFKVCTADEWHDACRSGAYAGSPDDARDGFIHLSTGEQLQETLAKHYRDRRSLLAIAYRPADLGSALRWEPSRGGALFPHLYAPLPTGKAIWSRALPLAEDGVPQFDPADTKGV